MAKQQDASGLAFGLFLACGGASADNPEEVYDQVRTLIDDAYREWADAEPPEDDDNEDGESD